MVQGISATYSSAYDDKTEDVCTYHHPAAEQHSPSTYPIHVYPLVPPHVASGEVIEGVTVGALDDSVTELGVVVLGPEVDGRGPDVTDGSLYQFACGSPMHSPMVTIL